MVAFPSMQKHRMAGNAIFSGFYNDADGVTYPRIKICLDIIQASNPEAVPGILPERIPAPSSEVDGCQLGLGWSETLGNQQQNQAGYP